MVHRPESITQARAAFDAALAVLNARDEYTACAGRPALYADSRPTPAQAAELCGRGTSNPCPLLALCEAKGFTESVYADNMVYGGLLFKDGKPVDATSKPIKKPKGSIYS